MNASEAIEDAGGSAWQIYQFAHLLELAADQPKLVKFLAGEIQSAVRRLESHQERAMTALEGEPPKSAA